MTITLVTRHPGAVEWARRRGIEAVHRIHFDEADVAAVEPGDVVAGPLPIQIIAAINARGGRYWHIEMSVPETARGAQLTADDMQRYGARLVEYRAERVQPQEASP